METQLDHRPASLRVEGGPHGGLAVVLTDEPVILGRGDQNDLVVDDKTVSRRHALISSTPDGIVVNDLQSENGTYVNGSGAPRSA